LPDCSLYAVRPSETQVNYQTVRRHTLEDSNFRLNVAYDEQATAIYHLQQTNISNAPKLGRKRDVQISHILMRPLNSQALNADEEITARDLWPSIIT
jgi:hypothetical protein